MVKAYESLAKKSIRAFGTLVLKVRVCYSMFSNMFGCLRAVKNEVEACLETMLRAGAPVNASNRSTGIGRVSKHLQLTELT